MTLDEITKYSAIFASFTRKDINIVHQMLIYLRKMDLTIDDFLVYAQYLEDSYLIREKYSKANLRLMAHYWSKNIRKCDKCGKIMQISSINTKKCNRIPDKKIKSVWTCSDLIGCGYQMWNTKPANFYNEQLEKSFIKEYGHLKDQEIIDLVKKLGLDDGNGNLTTKCGGSGE